MIYERFMDLEKVHSHQHRGLCPFHADEDPSLYVKDTGQWFCFGCDEGGGPVKFIQKLLEVPEDIAQYIVDFYDEHDRLPLPNEEEIRKYQENLSKEPAVLAYLKAIGVTDDVIEELEIGWEYNRLIFPIKSRSGYYVNLRKYMPPGSLRNKHTPKTIHVRGLGHARYFPYHAFDEQEIFIVEGEKDLAVARSQNINAVTSTSGGRIPTDQIHLFKNKDVYIMVDTDNVGTRLATQYKTILNDIAKSVHRVILPTKDFAEYYELYKDNNIKRFIEYDSVDYAGSKIRKMKLKQSLNTDTIDEIIVLENMKITGKHFNTYTIPTAMTINCSESTCNKECPFKEVDTTINVAERDALTFVQASDTAQSNYLKQQIGCAKALVKDKQYINAQIIYFQEDVTMMSADDYYNQMQTGIYMFNEEPLQTNKTYNFKAVRTTNPKTQQIVFIILEAQEKTLSIEVNEEKLKHFSDLAQNKSISELLDMYYDMWTPHLEVFGRKDLFSLILLTYLSVIGFYWGNTLIKGWLDCLVVGDTRTGKSKLVKNFMRTLGVGAYVSGENSRKTGIIGGIQRLGDNWSLSWGVVPLNDKRLAVIDEASGLAVEDIQELSQMRSEGIISITKIIAETTTARTRLFWISNPRSGKQLSDYYWKGVDALREFLPVQEDLARFDVVTTAALEDVDNIHVIDDRPLMSEQQINLWRQLVLFAWDLKPEQIVITNDLRRYIIDISEKMGSFYKGLPLFLKTNGYEKLTRVAIAAAVLTFNYKDGNLIVTREHIDFAKEFIEEIYAKDSFRFKLLSEKENRENVMTDDKKTKINRLFDLYENLGLLFESGTIRSYMIQEILGIERDEANKLTAELLKLGFIKITPYGYKATPQFLDTIREVNGR